MKCIKVSPGGRLEGKLSVQGSKNSALPVMAAALLHDGFTIIKNCPRITDVDCMALLLTSAGCRVFWQNNMLVIDAKGAGPVKISEELAGRIRASILLMGAMFGRFGESDMPLPGGCRIGRRPIDMHIKAMQSLGADCRLEDGRISFTSAQPAAADIHFDKKSVGATQNAILAAVRAEGTTVITNAAVEPEVCELCLALCNMGADIKGIGTHIITVTGVSELFDSVYEIRPDRIVLGTYMGAVAACGGDVIIDNCTPYMAHGFLDVMTAIGVECNVYEETAASGRRIGMHIAMKERPHPVNYIATAPYPGFPTDMQPIVMAVLSTASGESHIEENIFENRLAVAKQLNRMGADIIICDNRLAEIKGVPKLRGASMQAQDLRAAAGLLVAALAAESESVICNAEYILRGYENISRDLALIGAEAVIEHGADYEEEVQKEK